MKHSTKLLLVLASLFWAILGTSCATWHGLGHDVEAVGDNIQQSGN